MAKTTAQKITCYNKCIPNPIARLPTISGEHIKATISKCICSADMVGGLSIRLMIHYIVPVLHVHVRHVSHELKGIHLFFALYAIFRKTTSGI